MLRAAPFLKRNLCSVVPQNIKEIKIIYGGSADQEHVHFEQFEKNVNKKLAEGWLLYGPPQIKVTQYTYGATSPHESRTFSSQRRYDWFQPMIKEKENK